MPKVVKRIWDSAPLWAWIVMAVCVVILVVGLIISSNRTAPTSPSAAETLPTTSTAMQTPATVAFVDDARANPETPKTLVLLGDSTGADPNGWAPALGESISQTLERPVATRYWNSSTDSYGPMVGLGDGPNGPVGYWNASASGRDADYALDNLDAMITPDVTPDLIMLNFGHTQDTSQPLAPQLQPLIDELRQRYPEADLVAIKQSPAQGADTSAQLEGFAAAMDAEGIQVIDVSSAFPTSSTQLSALLRDSVNPNAEGQQLWTRTVLSAFGLPEVQ
ncbi:SGNH/GDSL hydrolase family protein [Gordonia sp. PKS22-38]|uniref:SGNH/GDSL hydrolase family protein n=1 Tax=Gordonia prachuapensis TaxID=3115651 RepID=A0ABU7MYJ2_9ACTN|nr:SGNH/GDSL hydrolase family protein [Gordonia sp. PKS22-38]